MNNETMENLKFVMMNSNYRNHKNDPVFDPIGLSIFTKLKFDESEEFLDLYDKISYTNDEHYKNLEMQKLDITGVPVNGVIVTDLIQVKIFEILIRLKEIVDKKNCNIVLYDLNMWQGAPDSVIIHCELKYFIEE